MLKTWLIQVSVFDLWICRRRWQGDPNVMIDRFDVRAHMDCIPETKSDDVDKQ